MFFYISNRLIVRFNHLLFFQSNVVSILSGEVNGDLFLSGWLEDADDPGVDHLLQLVREHHKFTASMFFWRIDV